MPILKKCHCGSTTFIFYSKRGFNNWLAKCENGHRWTPGIYDEPALKIKFKEST